MKSYSDALRYAEKKFNEKSIKSSHLDAIILLEKTINKGRSYILAHSEENLSQIDKFKFKKLINKRSKYKPVAQLLSSKEFYGRNFHINKNVLTPRPETEEIIVQFDKLIRNNKLSQKCKVCDLGTGSGVIGITLKLEHPDINIDLVDLFPKTLRVAKKNVVIHSTSVNLIKSDLLSKATRNYDVIVANLPYVPNRIALNNEAKHEPGKAIFAREDGIYYYRRMFDEIKDFRKKPLYIILEFLDETSDSINYLAKINNYKLINRTGLVSTFSLSK
jgi:release factor glutamine methyltransferase